MTGYLPPISRRRRRSEAGSATVEITILAVPVMLLVAFVMLVGRLSAAQQEVGAVARDVSRQASQHSDPQLALQSARAVARSALEQRRLSCQTFDVVPVQLDLRPGGTAAIEVVCHVSLGDLVGLNLPGERRIAASATSAVDGFRGGG